MQKSNLELPTGFERSTEELLREVANVEGYLAPNEMRFLALLAAVPTAEGEILEIGSFKGRSTIILARASEMAGEAIVNAVDPMDAPSETDPDLGDSDTSFTDFQRNIIDHGVASRIRLHRMLSSELAETWDAPLRLLWIDGDHTYEGTKIDFESFTPHLSDGSIVAIHDVLHEFEGGARVFMENILLSPNFGQSGFCGSIAWSRYYSDAAATERYREQKLRLYKKLSRLIPYLAFGRELRGFRKKIYKLHRSRVPHGSVDPELWLTEMDQNA